MKIKIVNGVNKIQLEGDVCLSKTENPDNKLFILNETGALIWTCLENSCTLRDIENKIKNNYQVDNMESISNIIENFLNELQKKGLIICE
jgi:hypothetical protein